VKTTNYYFCVEEFVQLKLIFQRRLKHTQTLLKWICLFFFWLFCLLP